MSKEYIRISRKYFETTVTDSCDVASKLDEVQKSLKSISTYSKITEEEIDILEKAWDILIKKAENLEYLLEDDNNVFYNDEI